MQGLPGLALLWTMRFDTRDSHLGCQQRSKWCVVWADHAGCASAAACAGTQAADCLQSSHQARGASGLKETIAVCLIRGVEGLYLSIRASQLKLLIQLQSAARISHCSLVLGIGFCAYA